MTELEFLDRQQALAAGRLQRALLGGDGVEAPVAALERATIRRPWLAVGTAAVLGGLVGTVLGRSSGRTLIELTRLAGRPVWHALRRGHAKATGRQH
jgi:hypothetical protein